MASDEPPAPDDRRWSETPSALSFGGTPPHPAAITPPVRDASADQATRPAPSMTERPRSRGRARGRAVALLVVALLAAGGLAVAVVGGSGGVGGAGGARPTGPVAQAAYVTTEQTGIRFTISLGTTLPDGQTFEFGGEGAFNTRQLEGRMTLTIAGKTIEEIVKDPFLYVKLPLETGREWAKVNLNAPAEAAGVNSPFSAGSASPTLLLDYLKAGGQVTVVGKEHVNGVPTTHYHALADLERYASLVPSDQRARAQEGAEAIKRLTGSTSLPIDVWVDSQMRVRRFATQLQLCSPAGKITETIRMDILDFGPQPPVTTPPDSQTVDITEKLKSAASGAVSQLSC